MPTKHTSQAKTVKLRIRAESALREFDPLREYSPMMADLYRRAEAKLREQKKHPKSKSAVAKPGADTERMLHELQVHQVELEMQNAELQENRDRMEVLLEKYSDLYDFAPVGYFSLDESGRILEMNLTGAILLGVERSRLVNQRLSSYVAAASRTAFSDFLNRVFGETGRQEVCEAAMTKAGGVIFWAGMHGIAAISASSPKKWCRVAVSDITSIQQAEEAQHRVEVLGVANRELKGEITRRKTVEESLRKSERGLKRLLEESRLMQEKMRRLSHEVLHAQEEERKRISRELHDVISQTLAGINVRLAILKKGVGSTRKDYDRNLAITQRLVQKSVSIVHEFARELRPAVLDDLGLVPALHTFLKSFTTRTGVRTHLTAFAGIEELDTAKRTVFYRVAQEALMNVSRHAKASRVDVDFRKLATGISMKIHDDGKSFRVDRILHGRGLKRLGLLGMRERVEMVAGTFCIESAPGKGTTVDVEIPLVKVPKSALKKSGKATPLKCP